VRQRELDLALLRAILSPANEPELGGQEQVGFTDMLDKLVSGQHSRLTPKQRSWATDVESRLRPIDVSKVPRGREVVEPEALKKRPLKPPMKRIS
jgi:hypothetical protein